MDKKKFGQFVKESRLAKGYTQQEFADMLMIDVSAVSKWERGVSYPDITLIPDISKNLGVSIEELIESSKDTEYRKMKNEAKKFQGLKKTLFIITNICFLIPVITCFICNIAIDRTLDWFLIVLSSLVLGYFSIMFIPLSSKLKIKKFTLLLYFIGLLLLTIFMLLSINAYSPFNIGGSILLTLYCFAYPIAISLVHLIKIDGLYRAIIDLYLFLAYLLGLFYVLTRFMNVEETLAVNFNDWSNYSNGNTAVIISSSVVFVSIVLLIIKKCKKD